MITYVPDRNRHIMTNACGKRTLVPYTAPFRAPLSTASTSWYFGSRMTRSIAVCVVVVSAQVGFDLMVQVQTQTQGGPT